MSTKVLKIHPADNVVVALADLRPGEQVRYADQTYQVRELIPAKHKFAIEAFAPGDAVTMYGVLVGRATQPIAEGGLISTQNLKHAAQPYQLGARHLAWPQPEVSRFAGRTFLGYHRADGRVGTANHWLVVPLVFCENRNLNAVKEALVKELGYATGQNYALDVRGLVQQYQAGANLDQLLAADILLDQQQRQAQRLFPNVDGIKFLNHEGGCGGTRQDSDALCGLLAGYITHPNVAGATVLSLGCQHAQVGILMDEIKKRDPQFNKPLYVLGQQESKSEPDFVAEAVKKTFAGLVQANQNVRRPAPLSKLCVGLECGGSDGFSGISANPAIGHVADMLAVLGGTAILSEFPELCGVEQELSDRCVSEAVANKFIGLMRAYEARAFEAGSGFDMNPSPGNIKDGLITDAIKSAGAAKKGGTSPITQVLDYPERSTEPGLNLLCTPGNDVESTTALAAAGCNLILFTTGLGTPTGNPVAPTLKIATNSTLARRMADIIDVDAGTIITGQDSIASKGEEILELMIKVASGEVVAKAVALGQDDFIPWKRGVSL
ncbi:MAG: altronate dehydratase family protein [Bernardetiaceae bacterium]|nr:altronate dehydratase family protein [Bernardetiaceae bacterium]